MRALYYIIQKDLKAYFSHFIGIGVLILLSFLVGFMNWMAPGFNLIESGFASLYPFFAIISWLLMLFVPAIGMSTFSDEYQLSTFSLLLSRPLSVWSIVIAKFITVTVIVLLSLCPMSIYIWSMSQLSLPVGDLDWGGIKGAIIGLCLLVSCFSAVSVFTSVLSRSSVGAFILGFVGCFMFYYGFSLVSELPAFYGRGDYLMRYLGIDFHYESLSRGVIHISDFLYMISFTGFFLFLSVLIVHNKYHKSVDTARFRRLGMPLFISIAAMVLLNYVAHQMNAQWDLTSEKVYTFSDKTKEIVTSIEEPVEITVYLTGDLPASFVPLKTGVRDILYRMNRQNYNVSYHLIDPNGGDIEDVHVFRKKLSEDGLPPVRLRNNEESSEKLIYPYALCEFGDRKVYVNLLESLSPNAHPEASINESIRLLEYKFASSLQRLSQQRKYRVAFSQGHDELSSSEIADLASSLSMYYEVSRKSIDTGIFDQDVLILPKPRLPFLDTEKFLIDQYLMSGGKVVFLLDALEVDEEALFRTGQTTTIDLQLNLSDMLFKYGVRIRPNLVSDLNATKIPLVIGSIGGEEQIELFPWYFNIAASTSSEHSISNQLDAVRLLYASSLDTLSTDSKTEVVPLLVSSPYTHTFSNPVPITLSMVDIPNPEEWFSGGVKILALLRKGGFRSAYQNRVSTEMQSILDHLERPLVKESSPESTIVVVGDGDIARNEFDARRGTPLDLGYDKYENYKFANKQFLMNTIEYMTSPVDLLPLRNRSQKLRLLDRQKLGSEKLFWQLLNIGTPSLILLVGWILFVLWRRQRYA